MCCVIISSQVFLFLVLNVLAQNMNIQLSSLWCQKCSGNINPRTQKMPYWISLYPNNWYHFIDWAPASAWLTTNSVTLVKWCTNYFPTLPKFCIVKTCFFSSTNLAGFFLSLYINYNNSILSPHVLCYKISLGNSFCFLCVLGVTQRKAKLCKGSILLDTFIHIVLFTCNIYIYIYMYVNGQESIFLCSLFFFSALSGSSRSKKSYIPSAWKPSRKK